jgi:hypothetical protein
MIGTKVKIKNTDSVVKELQGLTGTIKKIREDDNSATREFYDRTKEQCPDEIWYYIAFDKVLDVPNKNLDGWNGVWLTEDLFNILN